MLGITSITYYFAVEKVNARSQTLKISTARQDMLSLDESVLSVAWQPGSARLVEVADSGGRIIVQPQLNSLSLTISDGQDIHAEIFNQTIAKVRYELPYSNSPDSGLYLRGDSRSIVNQSGSLMTQLSIERGVSYSEIVLKYRPTVSSVVSGEENGKPVNTVRVYIVNLNSSETIATYGKIPLRISCESDAVTSTRFEVSYLIEKLSIESLLGGVAGRVTIPVSASPSGAVLSVQIIECNVKIERSLR